MTRHRLAIAFVATTLTWGAACSAGCSSVPNIRFVDDDAGELDAESDDASADSPGAGRRDGDADPPGEKERGRCDEETFADGVCCGWKYCVGCEPEDCFECLAMAACSGSANEACCKRSDEQRLTCGTVERCRRR